MIETTKYGNSTIYEYGEPQVVVWRPKLVEEVLQTSEDYSDTIEGGIENVATTINNEERTMNDDNKMDKQTAMTMLGIGLAAVGTVFGFIATAVHQAFWTAFQDHAAITWGMALVFGFILTIAGISMGLVAWWWLIPQLVIETLTVGSLLTISNFAMQAIWNIVKRPVQAVASAVISVTVSVAGAIKSVAQKAASWIKGLFTKMPVMAADEEYDHRRRAAEANVSMVAA